MIDLTNKKLLETKFAEDFATPLYPILADIYLLEGDLVRARKVCEVGLDEILILGFDGQEYSDESSIILIIVI